MRLTSMDINNKEFKKVIRGYDQDQVDEFLDQIAENYEELYKENSSYKEKITVLNEKLDHYAKIEDTIQNTLLLAQNAAEQAKQSAKTESELVIKNANDTARNMIDRANNEVLKINDDYEEMKQEFIKFRAKYRNFMNTQLDMFNQLESDFEKNYNITNVEEVKEKEIEDNSNDNFLKDGIKNLEDEEESFNSDLNEIKSFFVKE